MEGELFSLQDKVALIVGRIGDIGTVYARAYAYYGARIIIFDRGPGKIWERLDEWKKEEIQTDSYCGDIADEGFLESMVKEIAVIYGRIDIALSNTTMTNRKPTLEFTTAQWRDVIGINLNGAYYSPREVGHAMCGQDHGKIIQILLTGAYRSGANLSACGASKAGIPALVKCLAVEWAPHNIQVDGTAPTVTETGFTRGYHRGYPERAEAIIQNHPYKRLR